MAIGFPSIHPGATQGPIYRGHRRFIGPLDHTEIIQVQLRSRGMSDLEGAILSDT